MESAIDIENIDFIPADSIDDFNKINENLHDNQDYKYALSKRLKQVGGKTIQDSVKRFLNTCITDRLSTKLNRNGSDNKVKFESLLENLIINTVRFMFPRATDCEIKFLIAKNLKNSKDRFFLTQKRNSIDSSQERSARKKRKVVTLDSDSDKEN